jgi:hypothetical protein
MNWEAIAATGELIGASAVVVSLIYLAAQIRQNTRQVRPGLKEWWNISPHKREYPSGFLPEVDEMFEYPIGSREHLDGVNEEVMSEQGVE